MTRARDAEDGDDIAMVTIDDDVVSEHNFALVRERSSPSHLRKDSNALKGIPDHRPVRLNLVISPCIERVLKDVLDILFCFRIDDEVST